MLLPLFDTPDLFDETARFAAVDPDGFFRLLRLFVGRLLLTVSFTARDTLFLGFFADRAAIVRPPC